MIQSKEYLEMLDKIPTHIMLALEVHTWQEGDEWWASDYDEWQTFVHGGYPDGLIEINDDMLVFRRPIPQHIRENAAWFCLARRLLSIKTCYQINVKDLYGEWYSTINDQQKIALGGKVQIVKYLSEGDLMSSWMAGQI